MNEIVLINMLSYLDPSLLEDNYVEKDMKKGFLSFLFRFFKKTASGLEFNPLDQISSEEDTCLGDNKTDMEVNASQEDKSQVNETEELNIIENMEKSDDEKDADIMDRGFSISIFKKNFRNLFKIISGIAAAFILVIGIVIILLKRHKSGAKLYEKKIQIIY